MAFTKLTTDVENIQKLADRPQLSAQQLKAAFDGAGADIKAYLKDVLVPEMEAVTAAEKGALIQTELSATLATNNDQTLFAPVTKE